MPARDHSTATETTPSDEHIVIFQLDDEHFGLDIQAVQEIVRMQNITPIPGTEAWVMGITNLRGRVVPVLDMRLRCGKAATEMTAASRIIVIMSRDGTMGLTVDAVTEVIRIAPGNVEVPAQLAGLGGESFIRGIAKLPDRLVSLVDLHSLFASPVEPEEDAGSDRAAA